MLSQFGSAIRSFAVAGLVLAISPALAFAQQYYTVDEISGFQGDNKVSAYAISEDGRIAARAYHKDPTTEVVSHRSVFIWNTSGTKTTLTPLDSSCPNGSSILAWEINSANRTSGAGMKCSSGSEIKRAAFWNIATNTVQDLGDFVTDGSIVNPAGYAFGLNDTNSVAGHADRGKASGLDIFHAFVWNSSGGLTNLGTLNTNGTGVSNYYGGYSIAYDINNTGRAVGLACDNSWAYLPFVWSQANGMSALNTGGLHPGKEWYAVAINENNVIGGHVISATDASLPAYWPSPTGTPTLLTMSASWPYGEIYGLNEGGQFVGMMWDTASSTANERGFMFDTSNGVRDLNSLINPSSGIVITSAVQINNNGQIAATGTRGGVEYAYRLSPPAKVPASPVNLHIVPPDAG